MPEFSSALLYGYTPEQPKKPAIIKVSCGIGDTDGFPAFDVESDAYATKDDSKWGFLITGGAEFHMPLTVFQVTPDGLADKGGIRLGDIILEINEEDATQLTLAQAHEQLDAAGKKIHFLLKSMDDEDNLDGYEPGEQKSIVLRVPKPMAPLKAAAIEARLREMQRKLSEIAEIPKILSSTLTTVSQTFDKLVHVEQWQQQQGRKFSYDEDAFDYELSDADNDDDEDDDGVSEQVRHLEHVLNMRQSAAQVKDVTPESDYASEANYRGSEADGSADEERDDDTDMECDGNGSVDADDFDNGQYSAASRQFSRQRKSSEAKSQKSRYDCSEAADDDALDGEDDAQRNELDDEDEQDFLSTTYTWHLKHVPKLRLNDELSSSTKAVDEEDEYVVEHKQVSDACITAACQAETSCSEQSAKPEKQDKLDKLGQSWPWADREKIIYKQSTCHLVPRKPLGLVEQRIQLLAKQHLLENLQRLDSSNKSN